MGFGPLVDLLGDKSWDGNYIYGHCKAVVVVGKTEWDSLNRKYKHSYILISCSRCQRGWPTIIQRRESMQLSCAGIVGLAGS